MPSAIDEILDFVTSSPTLEQILIFDYSEETIERVVYLKERREAETISSEELEELREFERGAAFMKELKIRAARRIDKGV